MLKIIQRFDKHFSCHLQGGYVGWEFSEALFLAGTFSIKFCSFLGFTTLSPWAYVKIRSAQLTENFRPLEGSVLLGINDRIIGYMYN
jgi:hypothetical protein